jgi:hypothetical protein
MTDHEWRQLEQSPAVKAFAKQGFEIVDISGDDVVLMRPVADPGFMEKAGLGGVELKAVVYGKKLEKHGSAIRPPRKLSDTVIFAVQSPTGHNLVELDFPTASALLETL